MFPYPHKPAVTDNPIINEIRERWSSRAFSNEPVEEEKIRTLFEAARWAPSSSNLQEWHYLYATKVDADDRAKLESLLEQGNAWAKNASVLLIGFAQSKRKRSDGTMTDNPYALYDMGAATGYLALQCVPLGLMGHQMAGFDRAHANEVLGVPKDFLPASMMAIGYPGDVSILSAELQEREKAPRKRKEQKEFVFRGKWPTA